MKTGGLDDAGVLAILAEAGALDLLEGPGPELGSRKRAGIAPGDHVTNHFQAGGSSNQPPDLAGKWMGEICPMKLDLHGLCERLAGHETTLAILGSSWCAVCHPGSSSK